MKNASLDERGCLFFVGGLGNFSVTDDRHHY